ncbi:N-formylglutamate deformylase [Agrobacterium rubi]|uniref:N-formylglutamate deformylase n=1 Tax=Agrobacterium rubi TaxID=28099 RepID=A0AAE7R8G3_9HYPH|nr:N-formylglutamate deformylase [Agrobacterium rubi]NTE88339.1 N-formylglutamate deformylase [Agrobacterium rubi]NTF04105.1 N-formylglutamate deformylase [Agrobacterium rubi]NTF38436.1 N-formylglutamate deformylase [Agrobacterium rubi]OCJ47113.1 N-formylglutamate deformylase [Agrobacterium rubi]QTG02248.1 N-formylglutamate deformylase [Agrobacterium rubi]
MSVLEVKQGSSPVILGFPHTGTDVPPAIWERLNDNGRMLADTDWYIHQLYDGLLPEVTTVRATFHRYVIDANRDPDGASLYPGQNTTGLVPDTDFDGLAIWKDGEEPTEADIAARLAGFHATYHAALAAEIERVKAIHGVAVLYDCHSIRSHIPFLFEGKLPDFNVGTDMGKTCDPAIEAATFDVASRAEGYDSILNGRFKGGWTTRHYGKPENGVHAIQMELSQATHLSTETPPFAYDDAKADRLRTHLKDILTRIETVALILSNPIRGTK